MKKMYIYWLLMFFVLLVGVILGLLADVIKASAASCDNIAIDRVELSVNNGGNCVEGTNCPRLLLFMTNNSAQDRYFTGLVFWFDNYIRPNNPPYMLLYSQTMALRAFWNSYYSPQSWGLSNIGSGILFPHGTQRYIIVTFHRRDSSFYPGPGVDIQKFGWAVYLDNGCVMTYGQVGKFIVTPIASNFNAGGLVGILSSFGLLGAALWAQFHRSGMSIFGKMRGR